LLWEVLSRSDEHKPSVSLEEVSGFVASGLLFGIGMIFHWRALQWPLIVPTIAATAATGVLATRARRRLRSREADLRRVWLG